MQLPLLEGMGYAVGGVKKKDGEQGRFRKEKSVERSLDGLRGKREGKGGRRLNSRFDSPSIRGCHKDAQPFFSFFTKAATL